MSLFDDSDSSQRSRGVPGFGRRTVRPSPEPLLDEVGEQTHYPFELDDFLLMENPT